MLSPPASSSLVAIAAILPGIIIAVNALSSTSSPASPPRHDFPKTRHGDRSAILQSDGFAKSIAFLDRVHRERYASYEDCSILGPAWKEHDVNSGKQLLSPSPLVSIADFTSYSRSEQRGDTVAPLGSSASQLSAEFASIARKQQGGGRGGTATSPSSKGFASSSNKKSGNTKAKKKRKKKWSADEEDDDVVSPEIETGSTSSREPNSSSSDGKPFLTCPTLFNGNFCHVTNSPIFTREECRAIIAEAESDGGADTWSSHDQYYKSTKITKRIAELPQTKEFFGRACIERIFPLLQSMYPTACPQGEEELRDFRIFTAKVLKYDAASGNDYLGVHHDGSLLTFLIGLNGLDEYDGGGTYMEALGKAVRYEAGHLCCHPGIVRHGGDKVTSGVRYVLAAWIDISGVIEYDRQLCEEADLTRMSGRLDQTIQYDIGGAGATGNAKPDKRLDKAEKWYLYSLAAGETYGHDSWEDFSSSSTSVSRLTSENAWLGLGQLWLDQQKSVEASDAFRNALDLSPYNTRAWISYGLALVNMNDTKGAEHAFQTAANLNEFEFDALSNLGLLYSMLERHQDAADTYEKAAGRINQGSDGSIKADKRAAAELYTNWGVTLCDLGKYREAMVVFAKAVVVDNTFHDAASNLKAVKDALGA